MQNAKPYTPSPLASSSILAGGSGSFSTLQTQSTIEYRSSSPPIITIDAPPPIPLLQRLPPELIDQLLEHVPAQLLQRTALSLQVVFPDVPISSKHVFRHLTVRQGKQLMPLWRKLKAEGVKGKSGGGGGTKFVRTFCQESWRGDADILNNALRCLPDLRVLLLNIGTNFAPEHLEEMFEDPRPGIQRMEMRFRPYVEQASYYQFLKGSYFDTAIETLTRRWPEIPSFTHLSIVQDPPPRISAPPTALTTAANSVVPSAVTSVVNSTVTTRVNSLSSNLADLAISIEGSPSTSDTEGDEEGGGGTSTNGSNSTAPTSVEELPIEPRGYTGHGPFPYLSDRMGIPKPKNFAQPIVFFDIKCISTFGASPIAKHLTHLRLRVPSRDIAIVLIAPPNSPPLFPNLRFLDISTTNVRVDTIFTTLLRSYSRLEHLVLDRVNLFGFMAKDKGPELCKELGDKIVSAGLVRGKERERQIAAWELRERIRIAEVSARRPNNARARGSSDNEGSSDDDGDDGSDNGDDEAVLAARRADAALEAERQQQLAIARSRRGHRSAGHSTFSFRNRPLRQAASTFTAVPSNIVVPAPDVLHLVLPPLPTLKTLCIGGEAHTLSSARVREWEEEYYRGWREGLSKIMGWATHVAERYERAIRKAQEWKDQELKAAMAGMTGAAGTNGKSSGKGKTKAPPKPAGTKPPMDIRLYRFPLPDELTDPTNPAEPLTGLIEVYPNESIPRNYLEVYKYAVADAEIHANGQGPPACVVCTVPDCEGPARRGDEGGRVDGRGGMGGKHKSGCGHLLGRRIWGWEGCD